MHGAIQYGGVHVLYVEGELSEEAGAEEGDSVGGAGAVEADRRHAQGGHPNQNHRGTPPAEHARGGLRVGYACNEVPVILSDAERKELDHALSSVESGLTILHAEFTYLGADEVECLFLANGLMTRMRKLHETIETFIKNRAKTAQTP